MKRTLLLLICLLAAVSCESTLTGQEEKINVAAQNGAPGEGDFYHPDGNTSSKPYVGIGSDGNSSSTVTTEAELEAQKAAKKDEMKK